MGLDKSNVDFARENEAFAEDIFSEYDNQSNWVVTIRFYSLLHYVEETLQLHNYSSKSHGDRKNKIRRCKYIDNKVYSIYRTLEDLSKDARYECIEMEAEDVEKSEEKLNEGKTVLGYSDFNSDTKYSVD
jgi:CRISPR/Cas system CSM-associated protein Csm4 (group 5 of RAMP superfamily)